MIILYCKASEIVSHVRLGLLDSIDESDGLTRFGAEIANVVFGSRNKIESSIFKKIILKVFSTMGGQCGE